MTANDRLTKRRILYLIVMESMVAIMLLCLSFFTYSNDFKKISFSQTNNYIYNVDYYYDNLPVKDDIYTAGISLELEKNKINFVRINVEGVVDDKALLILYTGNIDKDGSFIVSDVINRKPLHNGNNDFKLTSQNINYCEVNIIGEKQNVIKKIQFRESVKKPPTYEVVLLFATTLILYGTLIMMINAIIRRIPSSFDCHTIRRDPKELNRTNGRGILPKTKKYIRVILFFTMVTASLLVMIKDGEAGYKNNYEYYIFTQLVLTLFTAISFINLQMCQEKIIIDADALAVVLTLVLYLTLSDIFVDKLYRFSGIEIGIVLTIFAIVWVSQKNNEHFIRDFTISVQMFLIVITVLSMVIRNTQTEGRFSGPITNPSIFAIYLGGVWAVLLGLLENCLIYKSKIIKLVIVEMLIVLLMLVMAQSATPTIAVATTSMLWGFRYISRRRGKKFAITIASVALLIGATLIVGTVLYFRNNDYGGSSHIIAKLDSDNISTLLSGRTYYWREYLHHMNLFGHSKKPFLWDHRILPHNALIGMMYWYGVPCVIPYILMMMMAVEKSWRFANTGLKYAAVPFYSIISFIIMSMADNVEQPFVWLPWIACYLMMAPILVMRVEDIEALEVSREKADEEQDTKFRGKHDIKARA